MNSVLLTRELNNRQNVANRVRLFWGDCFCQQNEHKKIFSKPQNNYPFWENKKQQQTEFFLYNAVITDINDDNVTVSIENPYVDQSECYVLNRKLFDFAIKIEDMIELMVENMPGQSCIKVRKYKKSQYYIEKEKTAIERILANNEEDDF